MGVPTSPVHICKMAADQIGEAAESINSIDPPSTETEKLFARHYDQTRRELLREFDWNFAKARDTAARDPDYVGTTGDFDYPDSYTMPNDCLKVLSIGGESEIDAKRCFDIEGRSILCDNDTADSLAIRYVKDETDVTLFDSLFIEALILKLALKCCFQLTKKKEIRAAINELFAEALPADVSVDGQERPPRRIQRSKYRDIRLRVGGYYPYPNPKYTVID